jgi:hypothetical protein
VLEGGSKMSKKTYYAALVAVMIAIAGIVGAQVSGTKPAAGAVATKEKPKPPTLEQRMDKLEKNQKQILAELKEIKENQATILENQAKILEDTKKIFLRMKKS